MVVGKRFNPYKTFTGSWIPNWLLERTEINSSCKIVYARLCQHSGKEGRCIVGLETIAEEIGMSKSMVEKCITELKSYKLLDSFQPGLNKCNQYFFLTHSWMASAKEWKQDPQYSVDPEPQHSVDQGPHSVAYIRDVPKEMYLRESEHRNRTSTVIKTPEQVSRNKPQRQKCEALKYMDDVIERNKDVAPIASILDLAGLGRGNGH